MTKELNLPIPRHASPEMREFIGKIKPITNSYNEKFSPNFVRWIVKQVRFHKLTKRPRVFCKKSDPTDFFVACYDKDETAFFIGSRLRIITCMGAQADTGMHTMKLGSMKEVTDEFWNTYFQVGKCAFDPQHAIYGERWDEQKGDSKVRICRWCGQRQKAITKMIPQEEWVNYGAKPALRPLKPQRDKRF